MFLHDNICVLFFPFCFCCLCVLLFPRPLKCPVLALDVLFSLSFVNYPWKLVFYCLPAGLQRELKVHVEHFTAPVLKASFMCGGGVGIYVCFVLSKAAFSLFAQFCRVIFCQFECSLYHR